MNVSYWLNMFSPGVLSDSILMPHGQRTSGAFVSNAVPPCGTVARGIPTAYGFPPIEPPFTPSTPYLQDLIPNSSSLFERILPNFPMVLLRTSGRNYKFERDLGQGGFGNVALVRDVETDELFALKAINCQTDANAVMRASNEVETLRALSHPNIITLIAAERLDAAPEVQVLILMEYCSGGNLNDRLARPDYDILKNLKWMSQIADALAYLHSCNTVHRDLKPQNVLLTDQVNEDIKLADFGLARKYIALDQNVGLNDAPYYMQTGAGTLPYMAPEVFAGHYTEKSDVFSLGILLYAIVERRHIGRMYGAFVFNPSYGYVGLGFAMTKGCQNSMVTFTRAPPNIQQLINNVLSYDFRQRMSASDVRAQLALM